MLAIALAEHVTKWTAAVIPTRTIPADDHHAQRIAGGVALPASTARFFSSAELAVLGAIRDVALQDHRQHLLPKHQEDCGIGRCPPAVVGEPGFRHRSRHDFLGIDGAVDDRHGA
jgi:hypothetical protein